jgi:hypothetical protein
MILATHALVGAAIGEHINNPVLIIAGSFAIHYILDTLRHGEYLDTMEDRKAFKDGIWKVALDLLIGFLIIFLIIFWKRPDTIQIKNILLGAVASIFPDFLTFLYWMLRYDFLKKIYKFHDWLHGLSRHSEKREWNLKNGVNDIIVSIISIILLII